MKKGYKKKVLSRLTKTKNASHRATRCVRILRREHFALVAYEGGRVTESQATAAFQILKRRLKRQGVLFWRLPPLQPTTRKPVEMRMGKGKGAVHHYVVPLKPGTILFEMGQLSQALCEVAAREAAGKLPIKTILLTASGRKWL